MLTMNVHDYMRQAQDAFDHVTNRSTPLLPTHSGINPESSSVNSSSGTSVLTNVAPPSSLPAFYAAPPRPAAPIVSPGMSFPSGIPPPGPPPGAIPPVGMSMPPPGPPGAIPPPMVPPVGAGIPPLSGNFTAPMPMVVPPTVLSGVPPAGPPTVAPVAPPPTIPITTPQVASPSVVAPTIPSAAPITSQPQTPQRNQYVENSPSRRKGHIRNSSLPINLPRMQGPPKVAFTPTPVAKFNLAFQHSMTSSHSFSSLSSIGEAGHQTNHSGGSTAKTNPNFLGHPGMYQRQMSNSEPRVDQIGVTPVYYPANTYYDQPPRSGSIDMLAVETNVNPSVNYGYNSYSSSPGSGSVDSASVVLGSPTSPGATPTSPSGGGSWMGWIKGTVSNVGNKVAQKAKNSMDNMITTLDPQMKEFIPKEQLRPFAGSGGDLDIIVASDAEVKVSAVREAFQTAFGRATVNGIGGQAINVAAQPVGFEAALQAAEERINSLRSTGNIHPHHPIVALENFIVELTPDCWYDMGLLLLDDPGQDILLQTYTQVTPIPPDYVHQARSQTPNDYPLKASGFSTTIGQIASHYLQVDHTQWHEMLTGVSRRDMIVLAARTLAGLYKARAPQR